MLSRMDGAEGPRVTRASRWSRVRSGWYRDAARSTVDGVAGLTLVYFAVGALMLVLLGMQRLPSAVGYAWLGAALVACACFYGLYTYRAWSRLPAAFFSAALALGFAAEPFVALFRGGGWENVPCSICMALCFGGSAKSLFDPKTRADFQRARGVEP